MRTFRTSAFDELKLLRSMCSKTPSAAFLAARSVFASFADMVPRICGSDDAVERDLETAELGEAYGNISH